MTVNSRVIKTFLSWSPDAVDVPLMNGLRIQILPTIEDLPRARKHQFAAFIASEALLVVWDDEAMHLIDRAKLIESELMELVWKTGEAEEVEGQIKKAATVNEIEIDEESGEVIPEKRATHLLNTILVAITLVIIIVMLGAGFRELAVEVAVDHNMLRLAFFALTPVQIFFTLVSQSALFPFWGTGTHQSYSSLPKLLSVALPNALVQSARCSRTRGSTLLRSHLDLRTAPFPTSQSSVQCTRKVLRQSLHRLSNLSSKRSQHMSFREDPPTCSSTTMVSKSSMRKSDRLVSIFTPTIPSVGQQDLSTVRMGSYEKGNSRRYVAPLFRFSMRFSE